MKTVTRIAVGMLIGLLLCGPTTALARGRGGGGGHGGGHAHGGRIHGHHHHFRGGGGFVAVGPWWWDPWWPYYPPYYYYAPQPVVVQEPPVYIQRAPEGYWYYCPSAHAYYPTASTCPESWIRVAPTTQ